MTFRAGTLTFVFLFLPALVQAETFVLNSGKKVQGKILRQTKDAIVIDSGVEDMAVTYYRDEIKQILSDEIILDVPLEESASLSQSDKSTAADKLENQAVVAIDNGDIDKGLKLMRQIIDMDPTPNRHMNYASVLFGNGVSFFKGGEQDKGIQDLRQSEVELNKAIAGFDKNKDAVNLSQCYFLLGEMYINAFGDQDKAKEFYTKSISYYDHPAAIAALAKLTPHE